MTSTIGSFSLTASPSFTNHLTTSPSWTPSPMSGSLNSRAIFTRSASFASPAVILTFCTFLCAALAPDANRFMATGRCLYGEEWGRGGVAQTGGRDLCPALRAGKIPGLLLLSVIRARGGDDGSSVGDHNSGCARGAGGCDSNPDFDCELLRRLGVCLAVPGNRDDAPLERSPLLRDRGRPRGCRIRPLADAPVGLGARYPRDPGHRGVCGLYRIPTVERGRATESPGHSDARHRRRDPRVSAERLAGLPTARRHVTAPPRTP